jgi:uncharacterized phage-associated protein
MCSAKRGLFQQWKLQKLVYYSQAWSLAWDESPLFPEEIQAWKNGPVCKSLYEKHRGKYTVCASMFAPFSPGNLTQAQMLTIDTVLDAYGNKTPQWLSDQTHMEDPWVDAYEPTSEGGKGSKEVITHEAMAEYYTSLK